MCCNKYHIVFRGTKPGGVRVMRYDNFTRTGVGSVAAVGFYFSDPILSHSKFLV